MRPTRQQLFKIKNSDHRKRIALCLKTWKHNHSIGITSRSTKLSNKTVTRYLSCSRFFINSNHNNYGNGSLIDKWMKQKGSKLRNKIAICLKIWHKNKNIKNVSKITKIHPDRIYILLQKTKAYNKLRNKNKTKINSNNYDTEYILRWAKKLKAIKLLNSKCSKCNSRNIFHLEFHHINQDTKKYVINQIWIRNWDFIKKEVQKCVLLCRNCHNELHHGNPTQLFKKSKKQILDIKRIYHCEECGYDKKQTVLDIHHINKNKEFNFSNYCRSQTNSKCIKKISKEINECKVLCKNCHKSKHINVKKFNDLKKFIEEKSMLL